MTRDVQTNEKHKGIFSQSPCFDQKQFPVAGSLKMLGVKSWYLDPAKLHSAADIGERAEAVVNAKVKTPIVCGFRIVCSAESFAWEK